LAQEPQHMCESVARTIGAASAGRAADRTTAAANHNLQRTINNPSFLTSFVA
jgi:hypothetical protein